MRQLARENGVIEHRTIDTLRTDESICPS